MKRQSGLAGYALRRVLLVVPLVLAVTIAVFLLTSLVPGGPVAALIGGHATNTAEVNAIRARYHLNESLVSQYLTWASQVLHGNLGRSIFSSETVASEIRSRLPVTLVLNGVGIFVALLVSVPLGSIAAARRGGLIDRVAVGVGVFLSSAPNFVMAIALVYLFGIRFNILPVEGLGSGLASEAQHLVLPCVVMAVAPLGFMTKIVRASMLEQLEMDYVAFARARGVGRWRLYRAYIVRNALIPIVTASGLLIVTSLTATVFVEDVFGIPGLGQLLVSSVTNSDIPVIQGLVLLVALWVIVANVAIDLVYVAIDPRVSFRRLR
ncbi:MAG: transporter permease [Acidimicrobiaceae bacterium]|jgi:peptide/nickel transport system permease protein|nr:transporter permease [Acidimicrobiaceae bacterium]